MVNEYEFEKCMAVGRVRLGDLLSTALSNLGEYVCTGHDRSFDVCRPITK